MAEEIKYRASIYERVLPVGGSWLDRFKLATEAGFDGVELEAVPDAEEASRIGEAAKEAGTAIHSVKARGNWLHPLSSEDPDEVRRGVDATLGALENARLWGAETMLVIPSVVTPSVSYDDAFRRSQQVIREQILPVALDFQVVLAIENVWRGFLLSPNDFVRFIDEFESPGVRACLDVGNMVFGHPEHWVRAVGSRIESLHIKDFTLDIPSRKFGWAKIGQGSVSWADVKKALLEVGFSGWVTDTEPLESFTMKSLRVAARSVQTVKGLKVARSSFWSLQRAVALRALTDAAQRVRRVL